MEKTMIRNPDVSRRFLTCLALTVLVACGTTTRFTALNPSPHPLQARPAATVQVFSTALPSAPYTEFGLIQGSQSSEFSDADMPAIIAAMRGKAGALGCDGLILNGVANRSTTMVSGPKLDHRSEKTLEGYWATCIVFDGLELAALPPSPLVVPAPASQPLVPAAQPAMAAASTPAPLVVPAPVANSQP
jgi:hypothetical protein